LKRQRLWLFCSALTAAVTPLVASAQDATPVPATQPEVVREYTPLTAQRLDQMVPKHAGLLGALAPANLAKPRPAAPFDVTGTCMKGS
jgi:hypothetical protein